MAGLTPKQENFCLAYLETGNASEAYRRAYSAGRMSESTINRKAKEVLDNGKITARIGELRAPVLEKCLITYEGHLTELELLREMAKKADQFSAAIKAEENRGKVAGFYDKKVEHSGTVSVIRITSNVNQ